jgi:hypothetical protein
VLLFAIAMQNYRLNTLVEQCAADGKKDYECHGIVRGRATVL